MKTSILRLTLITLICATCFICPAFSATVIDLGQEFGTATHRASGLLWSVTSEEPADELIKPLKVQKYRCRLTPWRKNTGLNGTGGTLIQKPSSLSSFWIRRPLRNTSPAVWMFAVLLYLGRPLDPTNRLL